MSELIVTAKSVELAIDQACEELKLSRDEISVEVLEMPTRRLFSSTPAKVKVTYGAGPAAAEGKEKTAPQPEKKAQPEKRAEKAPAPVKRAPAAPVPAAAKAPAERPAPQPGITAEEAAPAEEVGGTPATGEKVERAVAYFREVAAQMGVKEITVDPVRVNRTTILRVQGPSVGVLIGRRGETMESLSYLISLAANRSGGEYEKFGLDVAGYRGKREKDLEALARRVAARVRKTGRSYMLEPMNPYERRIIHSTVGEMEEVTSESTGEGADRRVVVRCTGPQAVADRPQGERPARGARGRSGSREQRSARGGSRGAGRRSGPPRESEWSRPPRPTPTGDTPVIPPRESGSLDSDFDLPLYGKIEF